MARPVLSVRTIPTSSGSKEGNEPASQNDPEIKWNSESTVGLARISHHLTVEARDKLAITSLRLLAVLNVLFKYASARRAARALY